MMEKEGSHRSGNGRGKNKLFKFGECYFESGKIDILKKSQGKSKFLIFKIQLI